MKAVALLLFVFILFTESVLFAEEPVDLQIVNKIRAEGLKNSQVKDIALYLTDVHGPRLTGSPQLRKASEWCQDKLSEWGLFDSHLESWGTFGKGWTTERYSVEMLEPQYVNLIAIPNAWTPGTDSVVTGVPVVVVMEEEKDFETYRGKLAGKIVLLGAEAETETHFEADAKRRTDEELAEMSMAPDPGASDSERQRRRNFVQRRMMFRKTATFLLEEKAAVVLRPSSIEHGTLRVMRGGSREMTAPAVVPSVVVAVEQYNRIVRLLEKQIDVKMAVSVTNSFHTQDSLGYNVVAELPGKGKLKDEVVMLGAHLDSWHAGTGATDNAAGCIVMLEAMRILKSIGVAPRRTIRIALWSGEEQGLLGSKGYVKKHFGDVTKMNFLPQQKKVSAYYNLDNGSGKIRGVYLQENDAVRPVFESWLKPFNDLGAATLTIRNAGGTDHLSFDAAGIPGFQFIQDPLDYSSRTWHTNMDVYDHLQYGDLMQAAVVVASFAYHTAMRDEMLPRKPLKKQ